MLVLHVVGERSSLHRFLCTAPRSGGAGVLGMMGNPVCGRGHSRSAPFPPDCAVIFSGSLDVVPFRRWDICKCI